MANTETFLANVCKRTAVTKSNELANFTCR